MLKTYYVWLISEKMPCSVNVLFYPQTNIPLHYDTTLSAGKLKYFLSQIIYYLDLFRCHLPQRCFLLLPSGLVMFQLLLLLLLFLLILLCCQLLHQVLQSCCVVGLRRPPGCNFRLSNHSIQETFDIWKIVTCINMAS